MKPGEKIQAEGGNPPHGGSWIYHPDDDEFECVQAPAEEAEQKEEE